MKIALLNVINKNKKGAMNKDLAGGMGTYSNFGSSFTSKIISSVKEKSVRLPILSFAYLQAILKQKGYDVKYIEDDNIQGEYDLVLIYGSIIDFKHEIDVGRKIKYKFPKTKVGFFGSFPTVRPEIFKEADFVIRGEVESYFLYNFKGEVDKVVSVKKELDLNELPKPDFDDFPANKYAYFPAIKEKPFLVLQASRGCPYSCSHYCAYGMIQGPNYRIRSAEKLVEDVIHLINKYKIKGLQFRDPTFGIDKEQVRKFCNLLIERNVKIKFGIETRLDLLDKELLELMYRAGLRNVNVGIETVNENVAEINKRELIKIEHQEEIIGYCKKLGVKVSAFYLLGLMGDTEDSIKKTIEYAVRLNTNVAQFLITCPYPGTKYYDDLKAKNLIIEDDFEKFDSVNIVFKHDKLSKEQLLALQEYSFKRYYFRLKYFLEFFRWRVREILN